jgi:hypothetical protein
MDDQNLTEIESQGLLGEAKKPSHRRGTKTKITQFLVAISARTNILILILGLVYWVSYKNTMWRSYERGFASDLREKLPCLCIVCVMGNQRSRLRRFKLFRTRPHSSSKKLLKPLRLTWSSN